MTATLALGVGRKLPVVLQTEAAECGLACLTMLVQYHGSGDDLTELRRRFGMSLRGATLRDLATIAARLGLATRPLRLELHELSELQTPCILHWDMNHFVVLRRASRRGLLIHDPAEGVRRLSLAEASRHFTGVALECTPLQSFERATPPPPLRLRALLGQLVGLERSLAQLLLMALAIELLAVASPLFMQWVVDDALVSGDLQLLHTLVLGFGLLLLIRVGISTLRGWMLMVFGATLKVEGRVNLFTHLMALPAGWFETRHLGDVVSRFGSQETILKALTTEAIEAVLDGLLAVLTLVVMCVVAPSLTPLVLVGALVYGLLRLVSYEPLRQAESEEIVWGARRDTHFLETIRGARTIKLFNGEEERRGRWLNLLVETLNRGLTGQKLELGIGAANALLMGGLVLLVVWLGAQRVLAHTLSVGTLLAFLAYMDQFLGRIGALIDKGLELRMLRLHAERLADIVLTAPERHEEQLDLPGVDRHPASRRPASVELRGVRFRYGEGEPWLLDRLDLRIAAGESVAIVGGSGCGKTTLLKLLATLLQPSEGDLLIDGARIGSLGLRRYRSMLGVVMQDDQLFAGSIAENIAFFSATPDQERIEACARQAAIHEEIMAMPMGYATLIGDMGTVLSGGQKQRVLIARALYKAPAILLLDEATSHLDVAREREVNAAIKGLRITRIVVAHRPETILSADRIIRLEDGRAEEELVPALVPAGPAAGGRARRLTAALNGAH